MSVFGQIGIAKNALASGQFVRFEFYIENFYPGSTPEDIDSIDLSDDLDAVFGAGNYSIHTGPTFVSGPGTLTLNPGFNGSGDTQVVSGGYLSAGLVERIYFIVSVTNLTDQGLGVGVYANQVTIQGNNAGVPLKALLTDLSTDGTDPDPNGDGNPSESVSTSVTLPVADTVSFGVAKAATAIGRAISLDFYLENLGSDLSNLTLPDNLDAVFGAGNYTITAAPSFVDNPGTITLNNAFNGSGNTAIIDSGTLVAGDTAQIRIDVEINIPADMGSGLGVYSNQVIASAEDIFNTPVSDLSDWGTDPDPNGNGNPTEAGENDPTLFSIFDNPIIGVAKNVTLSGTSATFDFYLENFGNANLTNISLPDDLDSVFGAGNFTLTSLPSLIVAPATGTINLNASFDGSSDTAIIDPGSSLAVGETAQIRIVVQNTTTNGYSNQVTASGQSPFLKIASDLSDYGTNPDPNGDGNPRGAGEDDPTTFVMGQEPVIGVAKTAFVTGSVVTIDFYLENFGTVPLQNLSLVDDLNSVFGAGLFYVSSAPTFIDNPGTITLNGSYDGNFVSEILDSSTLAPEDTAQIQMQVTILEVSDQGAGSGVYSNQALASGQSAVGSLTSDLSNNGTDPDPNGNSDPNEAGENDPTPINVTPTNSIGIAKQYISGGLSGGFPVVYLYFTLTNYGNQNITGITINDDLNAVYGAGNYAHLTDPEQVSGANTLVYNLAYNGNSNIALLNPGSSLSPGETVTFRTAARVVTLTDQGFGLGVYQNQVTVNGEGPGMTMVSDVSHEGNNPDPNSDGDPLESDPTVINLTLTESLGIAKDVSVTGSKVTLDFYLENLGTANFDNVSFNEDLDSVFGAGNYTFSTPTFIANPGGNLTLDGSFDGSASVSLLDPTTSSLAAGATAQIQMVVQVLAVANQGLGLGNYSNQVELSGRSALGSYFTDLSDFGTDPDPNGNGNANEAGENDATTFSLAVESPIGVAKDANVTGTLVTIDFYLQNYGPSTLSNVSLADSLDAAFGAGNYTISSPPAIIADPGTLTLNGAFDGSADSEILDPASTLSSSATAQIQLAVNVDVETDQGFGFGIYQNQSTASGTQTNGLVVSDLSDDGTDPDPNGSDDPSDPGEDDPTLFSISVNPAIGIAKRAYVQGTTVTFDFYIKNMGEATLTNVELRDPLNGVFGSGNYSIASQPALVSGPNTLTRSPQFFGFSIFDYVIVGGYLRPGETAQIRTVVNVNTVSDVGNGPGVYFNGVTVSSTDPSGGAISDTSDDGIDPDPNGNGDATEAGENDPTRIIIGDEAILGIAKNVSVAGQNVTFDYYLENLGGSTLGTLDLPEDLDAVFGAGNYSIVGVGPAFIDDPTTITLNAGFDGSGDTSIITSGTLDSLDTAQITLVVNVITVTDRGLGFGNYSNQVTMTGLAPLGTIALDISDFGIDPDPNGNGIPMDAGENDPTTFTVYPAGGSVGIAKTATVSGRQVTFDFYIENLGSLVDPNDVLQNFSVVENLNTVFGSGNFTLVSPPTWISVPRLLSFNPNFDGITDYELFDSGTMAVGITEHFQMLVEVHQLADLGSGLGIYSNQVRVEAETLDNNFVFDDSDAGTNPDPDGDLDPTELGENDPTVFTMAEDPVIGVAKTASVSGRNITFDVYVEDFSNVDLGNVSLIDDLDAVLGAGNFTVTSPPSLIVAPATGTFNLNAGFDGSASSDLLAAGSSLALGESAQLRFTVQVTTVTDQGSGLGIYSNQLAAEAEGPGMSFTTDLSDSGADPDPDGDSNPNESGENDPTTFVLEGDIGDLVWNDLNGNGLFDGGEPGISGVTVYLDLNSNNVLDGGEPTKVTNGSGYFNFSPLANGTYSVQIDGSTVPSGFNLTTSNLPLAVSLSPGEDFNDADFGYQQQNASIGDFVWNDLNGDGVQDGGEPGLAGVVVFLDLNTNGTLDGGEPSDTTDGSGAYDITGLATGTYSVRTDSTTLPAGFVLTGGSVPQSVTIAAGEDFNTADFGYQQQDASIGDFVWNDLNGDGVQDGGEPGLAGVTVYLDLNSNSTLDAGEPFDTSDGAGAYAITNLPLGTYSVRVDSTTITSGFVLTGGTIPQSVTLSAGENFTDADFGYQQQDASIGDFVWDDLNGDGVQDGGEPGIVGASVFLDTNSNGTFDGGELSTTTDGSGAYLFNNLPTGTYNVQLVVSSIASGYVLTSGTNPNVVNLAAGQVFNTADFGYQKQDASIGDFVWNDLNGDSIQDAGEPGMVGITVYLDLNSNGTLDGGEPSDTTDAAGAYSFTNLTAGSYTVRIDASTLPSGAVLTAGTDPLTVVLTPSLNWITADFGYQIQNASIGDFVWNDLNGDGVQDGGEPGLAGVTVFLDLNSNSSLDAGEPSDTTAGDGSYNITNLASNTYNVAVDSSTVTGGFNLTTANLPLSVTLAVSEIYTTADFGYQQQDASIGDFVWNDLNGDGVQDGGEPGLVGATVFLDLNSNGTLDGGEPSSITNGTGAYDITGLALGTYSVRVDSIAAGLVLTGGTNPLSVTIIAGEDFNSADFGYQQQDATIGDYVWNDLNGNGVQDGGEPGLVGVTIFIDANTNGTLDGGETSVVTDAAGAYDFTGLATGNYSIMLDSGTMASGFVLTGGTNPVAVILAAGQDYNDADFGFQQQDATIGDFVWDDLNGDGVQDGGEPGIPNITVFLDSNANGTLDGGEPSTVTDGAGGFDFTALPTGNYTVQIDAATITVGYNLTTANLPLSFTLAAGEDYNAADFGYQEQDATIGDFVWNDLNGDGVQDGGEPGLAGLTVTLFQSDGTTQITTTTTNGGGLYSFDSLAMGTYVVEVTPGPGFWLTGGTNPLSVTLTAGETNTNSDFGFQEQNASIGDFVWNDLNGDGNQDVGEVGIDGLLVTLFESDGTTMITTTTTAGGGAYTFDSLPFGTFWVEVTPGPGFVLTGGTNPLSVTLLVSQVVTDADFGFQQQDASIGDLVFNDLNGNGVLDGSEPGIAGVTVELRDDNNKNALVDPGEALIATTTTDGTGHYQFPGLATGNYLIDVTDTGLVLNGFVLTAGTDPNGFFVLNIGETIDNIDFGYQQQDASIGDFVWNDLNGDTIQDPGELGLPGVTVFIDENSNGTLDPGEKFSTTDANGLYGFTNLPMGTYAIQVDGTTVPTGYNLVTAPLPNLITIVAGQEYNTADLGYQQQDASIGDLVYNDLNGNGQLDPGEPGLAGVTLDLHDDTNKNGHLEAGEALIETTVTDANGHYAFPGLPTGNYLIDVTDTNQVLNGFLLTDGQDPTGFFVLDIGQTIDTIDFGYLEEDAGLGLAKEYVGFTNVGTTQVELEFNFYLANLGNVDLSDLQVVDDLRATFPNPVEIVVTLLASSTLTVNPSFDGQSDTNMLGGSDVLPIGSTAQIKLMLLITPNQKYGPYFNSAVSSALSPLNNPIQDISDEGNDPDPNGNGGGGDPGENDPTMILFPALVPTLGTWGLILLTGILGLVALIINRKSKF